MAEESKKKLGRPKSNNPSDKQLPRIRVTEHQLSNYRRAAQAAGKTLSKWAKDLMDDKASK